MVEVGRRSFRSVLRDGTRLTLRCIEPDDKQRLRDGIRHYSPATLYRRFFATLLSYGATARHESHGLMRVDLPVHATTGGHYGRMILEVRERLAAPD